MEASQPKAGLVIAADCKRHQTGIGHPERPARIDAVRDALSAAKLLERCVHIQPRSCSDEELLLCHAQSYLAIVKEDVQSGSRHLRTGDTTICRDSLEVARLTTGGVLAAVDRVMQSAGPRRAFCALRPPGHHATRDRGMGFCLFNSIAVAARYAQRRHQVQRVLIVDWDVHHGNGTQDIFYEDPTVFFFSTHQSPWYPGTGDATETGSGPGRGSTLNLPFPAGAGRREIVGAMTDHLVPIAATFQPELVLVSAGFDARRGDPLGGFLLTDDDFAELTRIVLQVAQQHAEGRLVSVLEGGYDLEGLGKAAAAHVAALLT